MTWLSIIIAGILTYFTRMTMIALVSRDMLGDRIKAVLAYVPSAVFPAIIFPAIFINDYGTFIEMNDPKIFGAIVAIIVGYFSRSIIGTIISGLCLPMQFFKSFSFNILITSILPYSKMEKRVVNITKSTHISKKLMVSFFFELA